MEVLYKFEVDWLELWIIAKLIQIIFKIPVSKNNFLSNKIWLRVTDSTINSNFNSFFFFVKDKL